MTKEKNKKKSLRSLTTTCFFILLLASSFLFGKDSLAVPNNYNKNATSTLVAAEWNNLISDFVNTFGTSTMVGPIGIGTTNPLAKLDVLFANGSIPNDIRGRGIVSEYYGVGAWGGKGGIAMMANGTQAAPTAVTYGNIVSLAQPLFYDGSIWRVGSRIDSYVGSIVGNTSVGSGFTFNVGTATGNALLGSFTGINEAMRITPAGNVGIGTTVPNDIFSIGNSGSAPAGSSNTGHNYTSTYLNSDDYALTNYGLVKTLIGSATSSFSNFWGGVATGSIWNLNSGNIGIGITNPVYKLDVQGIMSATGYNINTVTRPVAIGSYTLAAGTNLGIGNYYYFVTYTTAIGETNAGASLLVTTTAGNTNVQLSGIPVSTDPRVTGRKIYRTKVGNTSDNEFYLATIADNVTTTYTDSKADASLTGGGLQYYKINTTAKYITTAGVQSMILDTNLTTLGTNAGSALIAGSAPAVRTVLIGSGAGQSITTGQANVLVGMAGGYITTGSLNSVLGDLALWSNVTGGGHTVMGSQAARYINGGNGSVFLGIGAGNLQADGATTLTTASNSVYIGNSAKGFNNSDNNSIVIGWNAIGLGANTAVFGNSLITKTALFGNVGIGTTAPNDKLSIGSSGVAAPIGSADTGHNYTSTYLDSDDYALANYGLVKSLIGSATSSMSTLWGGTTSGHIWSLNTGNIGINTTTPLFKFDVNGTFRASSANISGLGSGVVMSDASGNLYATSTLPSGYATGVGIFVGASATSTTGTNNGNPGYDVAYSYCETDYAGSHVCTPDEMLNSIRHGALYPTVNVWIFSGPPGYTASANDCNGRRGAATTDLGAYWEGLTGSFPKGRGLLMACNQSLKIACCK